jgi:hypothetical protein
VGIEVSDACTLCGRVSRPYFDQCRRGGFRRSRTRFRDRPETVRTHRGIGVHLRGIPTWRSISLGPDWDYSEPSHRKEWFMKQRKVWESMKTNRRVQDLCDGARRAGLDCATVCGTKRNVSTRESNSGGSVSCRIGPGLRSSSITLFSFMQPLERTLRSGVGWADWDQRFSSKWIASPATKLPAMERWIGGQCVVDSGGWWIRLTLAKGEGGPIRRFPIRCCSRFPLDLTNWSTFPIGIRPFPHALGLPSCKPRSDRSMQV